MQEPMQLPEAKEESEIVSNLSSTEQILGLKFLDSFSEILQQKADLPQTVLADLKFSEKKQNEIKEKLLNETQNSALNPSKANEFFQKNSKIFSEFFQPGKPTSSFRATESDIVSKTIFAYYFCDKTYQVLSDKDTAAYKEIMPIDYTFPVFQKSEDLYCNNENSKFTNKKRYSDNNKIKKKKEENEENEELSDGEGSYCFPNCEFKRKSASKPMIMCDKCMNWYHTKCLGLTNEEFAKIQDKKWFCPNCND